jgi:hypothetical protein
MHEGIAILSLTLESRIAQAFLADSWRVFFVDQFDELAPREEILTGLEILRLQGKLIEETHFRCDIGHDAFVGKDSELPKPLVCRDCDYVLVTEPMIVPKFTLSSLWADTLNTLAATKKAKAAASL